jgi:hypothetical protein
VLVIDRRSRHNDLISRRCAMVTGVAHLRARLSRFKGRLRRSPWRHRSTPSPRRRARSAPLTREPPQARQATPTAGQSRPRPRDAIRPRSQRTETYKIITSPDLRDLQCCEGAVDLRRCPRSHAFLPTRPVAGWPLSRSGSDSRDQLPITIEIRSRVSAYTQWPSSGVIAGQRSFSSDAPT